MANTDLSMTKPAGEFDRFLMMWERSIHRFETIVGQVTEKAYRGVPVVSDSNYLGDRVGEIMIDTLVRHLVVAERHWLNFVLDCEDGASIPKPEGIVAKAELNYDDAGTFYRTEVGAALAALKLIDRKQLDKMVSWAGCNYTVMGFLWTILSHHTYHLGQIDLLMRQQGIYPHDILSLEALGQVDVIG
jgi:uncharacterized damage-inducible protein DinB